MWPRPDCVEGQVTCSSWNPLIVLETHSVPAARTTPEITEPPFLMLPGRSPLGSQMGKIRPSRSPRAQAAGPPPFCRATTSPGPPQAGGEWRREWEPENSNVGGQGGLQSQAFLVSQPSTAVLCRVGEREDGGKERHASAVDGPVGLTAGPLHLLSPLPGSLVPLTAFLTTVSPEACAGHLLFPCPCPILGGPCCYRVWCSSGVMRLLSVCPGT